MTNGAGQTPGPFLVSRHPLFRAAGRQRVFSWVASLLVVKSHLGSPGVVCHCGGMDGRGLRAPQLTHLKSSWDQGRTCRALPRAGSVSASQAIVKVRTVG